MKKIIRSLLLVSLLTAGLSSCKDDDSENVEPTAMTENELPADVAAIAISSPDHTILVEALTAADLVTTLQGAGPFTVFAPTDAAFASALGNLGLTKDELFADKELLTSILLHHVVSGTVLSTDLANGEVATLNPNGADVTVDITSGVMIDGANVTAADLIAGNGVVHVVDAVLVPSADDVTEIAINSPEHTILVEALTAADLVATLQGEGPFTVFAPTNAAFVAALVALELTKDELFADKELLTTILLHHVVSGTVLSTDLASGDVTTLSKQTVTVDLSDGVMIDGANVTAADLVAGNGVVHVIDAVLVPEL